MDNPNFPVQKTLQKMIKIMRFEWLRGPFIHRDRWPFIHRNQAFRRRLKSIQIWLKCMQMRHEINTINFGSRYCNGKNTYRLLACEYAWKRVHFRRSKCCFARVMDAKVVRNHTPSAEILWILNLKIARIHQKFTKMNAFDSNLLPGSNQNHAQKRRNSCKSAKIVMFGTLFATLSWIRQDA